jgi:hypothetical protein
VDTIKRIDLLTGMIIIFFLILCFHFHEKGKPGPWHQRAVTLWEKEEWGKLQALADNLFRVQKEDVEADYLAMLASRQTQNEPRVKLFGARLLDTGVINWNIELQSAEVFHPDTLRQKLAIFRTRAIYFLLAMIGVVVGLGIARKTLYHYAPIALCALGFFVLML